MYQTFKDRVSPSEREDLEKANKETIKPNNETIQHNETSVPDISMDITHMSAPDVSPAPKPTPTIDLSQKSIVDLSQTPSPKPLAPVLPETLKTEEKPKPKKNNGGWLTCSICGEKLQGKRKMDFHMMFHASTPKDPETPVKKKTPSQYIPYVEKS